jgi:small subunit ribosomal protein S8
MMTDPVSDMLARIRNALIARHERVEIPLSKLKESIAHILKQEGYISDVTVQNDVPGMGKLTLQLKYGSGRSSAIVGLKRSSRPGRRYYVGHDEIPKVMNGMGISILSTSRGVITDQEAQRQRVGGELLCEVW